MESSVISASIYKTFFYIIVYYTIICYLFSFILKLKKIDIVWENIAINNKFLIAFSTKNNQVIGTRIYVVVN